MHTHWGLALAWLIAIPAAQANDNLTTSPAAAATAGLSVDGTSVDNGPAPDEEAVERIRKGVPLGRFATREEVAAQCLHLAAPVSAYVTGECLVVDGGLTTGSGRMWEPGMKRKKRGSHGT